MRLFNVSVLLKSMRFVMLVVLPVVLKTEKCGRGWGPPGQTGGKDLRDARCAAAFVLGSRRA